MFTILINIRIVLFFVCVCVCVCVCVSFFFPSEFVCPRSLIMKKRGVANLYRDCVFSSAVAGLVFLKVYG